MELKTNNFIRQMQDTNFSQAENKQLVFSVADEIPYMRHDEVFGDYYEVLEISENAIDTTRLVKNMPFLKDHDHSSQLGAVKKFWIDENTKKLYVSVKFSRSKFAQSIKQDIIDLIRQNTSIGYYVNEFQRTGEIDGIPVLRAVSWTPYECSSVSVPASVFVGYNRSLEIKEQKGQDMNAQTDKTASTPELAKQKLEEKETDLELENKDIAGENLEEKSAETDEIDKAEKEKAEQQEVCPECGKDPCECEKSTDETDEEQKSCGQKPEEKQLEVVTPTPVEDIQIDVEEIRSLGQITNEIEVAKQFIAQKKSLEDFKTYLKNKNLEKGKNSIQKEKIMEKKYFSIIKAINNIRNHNSDPEEYENKVIAENRRKFNAQEASIVLSKEDIAFNKQCRAFSGTVGYNYGGAPNGQPNGGDVLIQSQYLPQYYAPNLRPQLTLDKTGYFSIESPDGRPIEWPVCTGGMQAGVYDLDGKLSASDMQFTMKQLRPHKIGATTVIPYSLLLQSAPKADEKIEADMIKALYQVRDEQVFVGNPAGANANELRGIINTAGINEVPVTGAFTWKDMLQAENEIRKHNVISENLAFVMNGDTYVELCSTAKSPGNMVAGFICENDRIKTFPVYVNNNIPSGTILLGDFNEAVVCDFDGLQIMFDPYTQMDTGAIKIAGWMSVDSVVQRPQAFTKIYKV